MCIRFHYNLFYLKVITSGPVDNQVACPASVSARVCREGNNSIQYNNFIQRGRRNNSNVFQTYCPRSETLATQAAKQAGNRKLEDLTVTKFE